MRTRTRTQVLRRGALCVSIMVVSAACAYHQDPSTVPLGDPGRCVPVDIAASADTAPLLAGTASRFNGSAAARLPGGGCAFARVQAVDAPVALRELTAGWPDATTLGPAPTVWVPGSSAWTELLNARLAPHHRAAMATTGTPFARSPLVVAMPAPMAAALGYPRRAIGWGDLERLAADPRGWGAYGHPEWGAFRLGKGNPNWSTTGLDQTIALDASNATSADARALEQSVVYYSDSSATYLANWQRLAAKSTTSALTYLSAAITDERSVIAYNEGHTQTDEALTGHATRPALALVSIYPVGASLDGDNPMTVLRAPWSSAAAQAGARLFINFALQPEAQAKVAAAGFRPARGAARADVVNPANGVDPGAPANAAVASSPVTVDRALTDWQADRRPARVLVLFDVSDSTGDTGSATGPTPSKLAFMQAALTGALGELAPGDDVGLRIFTTKLPNPVSPNWLDVVPTGPYATRRVALQQAIGRLEPEVGSPLYAATHDAFDAVATAADPRRINGVVVITDGYNEDDHDNNLSALLAHLGANPGTRVFTVAYGNQADLTTLARIAQATNAATYPAVLTGALADAVRRALANF